MGDLILSRSLDPDDYQTLSSEVEEVKKIAAQVGGFHPAQHPHRVWEYALLQKALLDWAPARVLSTLPLSWTPRVWDAGCSVGLSSVLCLAMFGGNQCRCHMTEIWEGQDGSWRDFQVAQMQKAQAAFWGGWDLAVEDMTQHSKAHDNGFDIVLCVSTLEHIQDEESAFRNLCAAVRPGGMLFLTMDFAPTHEDTYLYSYMRARIYNYDRLVALEQRAREWGLVLAGGQEEWVWRGPHVNDYSFASMVMVRP